MLVYIYLELSGLGLIDSERHTKSGEIRNKSEVIRSLLSPGNKYDEWQPCSANFVIIIKFIYCRT